MAKLILKEKIGITYNTEVLLNHKDAKFKEALSSALNNKIISALGKDAPDDLKTAIAGFNLDISSNKEITFAEIVTLVKARVDRKFAINFDNLVTQGDENQPLKAILGLEQSPSKNPLLSKALVQYNASKIGGVLQLKKLSINDELPVFLSSSIDKQTLLLSQWEREKNWEQDEVKKLAGAIGLMRVTDSHADTVVAFMSEGIKNTEDLVVHNKESLVAIMKKDKINSPDEKDNFVFAGDILTKAEQEHPSAFFLQRVTEKPEWLELDAKWRPTPSNEFKAFYAQNKKFDIKNEPIISLETGLLNKKIIGLDNPDPAIIKELSTAQQALQLSSSSEMGALLFKKEITIKKAVTTSHQTLMRELEIDANDAIQIKQKAQRLHEVAMNGFFAYRDLHSNPYVKNTLGNLNSARDQIKTGLGKKENFEEVARVNGLMGVESIEDLFGSQNYCECDSCKSVLSPAAYFVDLMKFIEKRVLTQKIDELELKSIEANSPIHLKNRRPDLWDLELTCENTNKRISYIEIVNEVISAFINKHLADGKSIAEKLEKEQPKLEFSLPYNQNLDEVRTWFSFFNIKRGEILAYLYPNPNDDEKLAIAKESLNLSDEQYLIIITDDLNASVDKDVLAFRRKSGLSSEEIEQIVYMRFWAGALAIKQIKEDGYIQKYKLEFETALAKWQGQMHRLIRLWKASGWSINQLDDILNALAITKDNLNKDAILNLGLFNNAQKCLKLDIEPLVALLFGVREKKTVESKISWEQLLPTNWVKDKEARLDELKANVDDAAVDLLLKLQAIFGLNTNDLLNCLELLKDEIGTVVVGNSTKITFNTGNLNIIYRYSQLYKWTNVSSFEMFVQLLNVWGKGTIKKFNNPIESIIEFAKYIQNFQKLQLNTDDLIYLFGDSLETKTIIEEDKIKLENQDFKVLINVKKEDGTEKYNGEEKYLLFFNKWLEIDKSVLNLFKNFIEKSEPELSSLFIDLIAVAPSDDTYIALSNIRNRLERLIFLTEKFKIDSETLKLISSEAKDCNYLKFGFDEWKNQEWVKEFSYLGAWIEETKNLKNVDIFKILRSIEKDAPIPDVIQKSISKWKKIAVGEVQSIVIQTDSITKLQKVWEQIELAKKLNLNISLLDKLKIDTTLITQSQLLQNAIRSKFEDNDSYESKIIDFKNKLNSNKRDALCNFMIFNEALRAKNFGFENRENLYQYFLLDVNMGDCFTLPRIVVATNSLQVYVHRCLMGLERSADEKDVVLLDIDEKEEWEWRKNYRVWEANRKIFLYPENYIEPEIRDNKSPEFKELEDELLQQKLNSEVVENAYKKYLQQIMTLAELKIAGAYNDIANNKIYIFGKTNKQPVEYYYRNVEFLNEGGVLWTNWEKMNVAIPAEDVSAIRHNGKLYVFWTSYQRKDISEVDGGTQKILSHTYNVFVNYSFLQVDNKWSVPQKIELNSRTNRSYDVFLRQENHKGLVIAGPEVDKRGIEIRENVLKEFERIVYRKPYPILIDEDKNNLRLDFIWTDKENALQPVYKYTNAKIDAYSVEVELVLKHPIFGNIQFKQKFNFNRFDKIVNYSTNNTDSTAPDNILINDTIYSLNLGGVSLQFVLSIKKDNANYVFSLKTGNSDANNLFSFKENNKEIKSGNVIINHRIDFVPVNIVSAENVTIKLSDQKMLSTVSTDFSTLTQEFDAYFDSFTDFFIPDGTATFDYGNYKIEQKDLTAILTTPVASEAFNLNPDHIQFLWNQISLSIDDLLDYDTQRNIGNQIDYSNSFGNYFYELFFHIPMRIADHLNAAGKYREANNWYCHIYNPTAIKDKFEQLAFPNDVNWRFAAFRNIGIKKLQEIYADPNAIEMYQRNPGNPHAIARLRIGAYQKNVVMKYIDNLMDWADYLFQQYTPDSRSEARNLYSNVKMILGNKPELVGKCKDTKILTYKDFDGSTESNSDFIYNLFSIKQTDNKSGSSRPSAKKTSSNFSRFEHRLDNGSTHAKTSISAKGERWGYSENTTKTKDWGMRDVAKNENKGGRFPDKYEGRPSKPIVYFELEKDLAFCFPPNRDFIQYWNRVTDRIFKLDNCLDFNGVKKTMPAFAPEIDPALLARMVAGGMSFDEISTALNAKLPNYRFTYLIEKAKQYCNIVQSFGGALFGAIEKRDSEELTLLRARQEQNILTLTTKNKKRQVEISKANYANLLENKLNIEKRKAHFEGLLDEGLITWENAEQIAKWTSGGIRIAEATSHLIASFMGLVPDVGSPFAMKYGGTQLSKGFQQVGQSLEATAKIADNVAALAGLEASHQRREQEWQFQVETATQELKGMAEQIRAAEINLAMAEFDLEMHKTNIEQYKELYEFYTSKFTNFKHYTFQVQQLQKLYRMAYNLANDLALDAQSAYKFERFGIEDGNDVIQPDNWNNEKLGLLAGERLMLQLVQLEKEFIDTDKRKNEIPQNFSMLQIAPDKLLELKTTGECIDFAIPEAAFDMTYPGYFRRIIKSVRISIPCITGPYTNIGATLSLDKSYIRSTSDDSDKLKRFEFTGCKRIATSNAQNDGGQFELNFRDERYLPFEGAGAVSSWTLSLPKTVKSFDYNSISDVIFHISYTAEYEEGEFKENVEKNQRATLNTLNGVGLTRVISLRHDFPTEWHKFNSDSNAADMELELRREHFPYFANVSSIKSVRTNAFSLNKDDVLLMEADNLGISKSGEMKIIIPFAIATRKLKDVLFLVNYECL